MKLVLIRNNNGYPGTGRNSTSPYGRDPKEAEISNDIMWFGYGWCVKGSEDLEVCLEVIYKLENGN
jgi:hypothetical protein